jgi:hypothetical protein
MYVNDQFCEELQSLGRALTLFALLFLLTSSTHLTVSAVDLARIFDDYNCNRIYWSPSGTQFICHYSAFGGDIVIFQTDDVSEFYILYENASGAWCSWAPYDGRYVDCHYNVMHQWWVTVVYDAATGKPICGYDVAGAYDMHHRENPWPECQALPLANDRWWHIVKLCGRMAVSDSSTAPNMIWPSCISLEQ